MMNTADPLEKHSGSTQILSELIYLNSFAELANGHVFLSHLYHKEEKNSSSYIHNMKIHDMILRQ